MCATWYISLSLSLEQVLLLISPTLFIAYQTLRCPNNASLIGREVRTSTTSCPFLLPHPIGMPSRPGHRTTEILQPL